MRHLRRHTGAPDVIGPYSIPDVLERWPAKGAALLKHNGAWCFPVLFGDTPDIIAQGDYRPSSADIQSDVDATPTFPPPE
jgi:hypothetical protein